MASRRPVFCWLAITIAVLLAVATTIAEETDVVVDDRSVVEQQSSDQFSDSEKLDSNEDIETPHKKYSEESNGEGGHRKLEDQVAELQSKMAEMSDDLLEKKREATAIDPSPTDQMLSKTDLDSESQVESRADDALSLETQSAIDIAAHSAMEQLASDAAKMHHDTSKKEDHSEHDARANSDMGQDSPIVETPKEENSPETPSSNENPDVVFESNQKVDVDNKVEEPPNGIEQDSQIVDEQPSANSFPDDSIPSVEEESQKLGDDAFEPSVSEDIAQEDSGPTQEEDVIEAFPVSAEAAEAYAQALLLSNPKDEDEESQYYEALAAAADLGHAYAAMEIAMVKIFGNISSVSRDVEGAFEIISGFAERGYPRAQSLLGFMFSMGIGTNSSQSKGLLYMTFAALGGDTFAEMNMGFRHHVGLFVPKSCESSLRYYQSVAQKVYKEAMDGSTEMIERVRLADELRRKRMKGQAHILQYYQLSAQQGGVDSQVIMGQLHYHGGHGFRQDLEQAVNYFERAAQAGDPTAMTLLGEMYAHGRGVPQDNDTAVRYYQKAAAKEDPAALSGLGVLYKLGQGVRKSESKAFELFSKAAAAEDAEGQLRLANQFYDGLGTKRDYRKAIHYYSLSAQQGNVLAMYNLGIIHANGIGTSRNCEIANGLFKNVAERGSWSKMFGQAYDIYEDDQDEAALLMYMFLGELGFEMAQDNAAHILDETYEDEDAIFGRNGSLARALTQWKRSASQGYTAALLKIGDYHYYGHVVPEDRTLAANEYRIAADNSNPEAMFNLGLMHEYGIGLPIDLHLAKRYYDRAAEISNDAKLPSTIMLTILQAKLWLQANVGPLDETIFSDILATSDDIQAMSLDEFLTAYENLMIGGLLAILAILLLAYELQRHQNQQHVEQVQRQAELNLQNNDAATPETTPEDQADEHGEL